VVQKFGKIFQNFSNFFLVCSIKKKFPNSFTYIHAFFFFFFCFWFVLGWVFFNFMFLKVL
jgi:hypothetical protein